MTRRTLVLQSRNPDTGETVQRNISNANPAATVQNIDTFMRSVNSLTNNTYIDSLIVDTKSVNEELNA